MDSINELIVKNVSTVFFIEPLGLNLNILDSYGLIDAYIGDKQDPDYFGYYVYVLFKKDKISEFAKVLRNELKNKFYVRDYDYYQKYHVVKYRFPVELINDFELVTQSKYSSVSEEFRKCFPHQHLDINGQKTFYRNSMLHRLVNRIPYFKDDILKALEIELLNDIEWWKKFDLKKEVLDINIIMAQEDVSININDFPVRELQ